MIEDACGDSGEVRVDQTESAWLGVRERISALRDAWTFADHSPEERNPFWVGDPLSPDEVADLESWLGIVLPSDYRAFLMLVGAGVSGLEPTLWPVERLESGEWTWGQCPMASDQLAMLVQSFPTERMDSETRMRACGPPPFEGRYADPNDFTRAFDSWAGKANPGVLARERTAGALCLTDELYGDLNLWIIVTGTNRGEVWLDCRDCNGWWDMHPALNRDGEPAATFQSWFLDRLSDHELQESSRSDLCPGRDGQVRSRTAR